MGVNRFRMYPDDRRAAGLAEHCAQARFVWNLALEQWNCWQPGRAAHAPGYVAQNRQLTEARATFGWLAAGSQTVQQQALRDFDQAKSNFYGGTHRRPTWRKAGLNESFRIVGDQAGRVEILSRRWARVLVPKVGWVRFRRSGSIPEAKSYRVTLDRAGRWHICFAAIPVPIESPGNGEIVGLDRGVAVSAALSTGELLHCRGLSEGESRRLVRLQQKMGRQQKGSKRRTSSKVAVARLKAREAGRRKDWVEKTSTDVARNFDLIRVEDLRIKNMTRSARGTVDAPGRLVRQKAGLNRGILANGWGLLVRRVEHKAPGRVEKVDAAYTSQRCSGCGHCDNGNRESQAVFCCRACSLTLNADVNAARNIAAGHAVTGRGAFADVRRAVKRQPQLRLIS